MPPRTCRRERSGHDAPHEVARPSHRNEPHQGLEVALAGGTDDGAIQVQNRLQKGRLLAPPPRQQAGVLLVGHQPNEAPHSGARALGGGRRGRHDPVVTSLRVPRQYVCSSEDEKTQQQRLTAHKRPFSRGSLTDRIVPAAGCSTSRQTRRIRGCCWHGLLQAPQPSAGDRGHDLRQLLVSSSKRNRISGRRREGRVSAG